MTREELLTKVNEKVDTTKFKSLSSKTINEELDDVLEDYGDGEEIDEKVITKLANRLKRMDGNVHKSVSDEMKKNKEAEEERRRKEAEKPEQKENTSPEESEEAKALKELKAEIEAMKAANKERDARAARAATIDSVKKGLKEKFDKAGLKLNGYFAKAAIAKLEIPDDANIEDLIDRVEKIYNSDLKEAGLVPDSKPNKGGGGGTEKPDEKQWDDIAQLRKVD